MRPSAATSAAAPCNIEVGPPVSLAEIASGSYRDDALVEPHDWPDVPDEDEYLTLPDEVPQEACHDTVTAQVPHKPYSCRLRVDAIKCARHTR